MFYPVYSGDDLRAIQAGLPGDTTAEVFGPYPILNRMGSLFVEATDYEQGVLVAPGVPGRIRSIKVNPNYLRAFPLNDSAGHRVAVPETTSNWVLLVPERYRSKRRSISSTTSMHKEPVVRLRRERMTRRSGSFIVPLPIACEASALRSSGSPTTRRSSVSTQPCSPPNAT